MVDSAGNRLIRKTYAWAISLIGLLTILGALATHAALERQSAQLELGLLASRQLEALIRLQMLARTVTANIAEPTISDAKFAKIQKNLAEATVGFEKTNDVVGTLLDRRDMFGLRLVPLSVAAAYREKPFEIDRWLGEVASHARTLATIERSHLARYGNSITIVGVALPTGNSVVKGLDAGIDLLQDSARSAAALMGTFHYVLACVTLAVLVGEAAFVFGPMLRRLRDEQQKTEAAHREIEHVAFHDGLTGLANRLSFRRALEAAVAARNDRPFALVMCDLNRFKGVNDGFGHQAGDELLREMSARIAAVVRSGDLVARLGGDEFAIIAFRVTTGEHVAALAGRIVAAMRVPWRYGSFVLDVGASAGVALCPAHTEDPDRLLAYADSALYAAKRDGTGWSVFDTAQRSQNDDGAELLRALPRAIEAREFVLHYQPKVQLPDGRCAGLEALVRWAHPDLGLLPPGRFLPVIHRGGRTVDLTLLILDMVAADVARWRAEGLDVGRVAVNMPESILTGRIGIDAVRDTLARHGLPGSCLSIEITEDVFLSRSADVIQSVVAAIAELGVRVAFDDFGTGFASLSHLRDFPFHEIKLDRSFVAEIGVNRMTEQIIRSILSLARALDKDVVAEGIETQQQLDFLRGEGCTIAQGFLFARPMPSADLERWIRQRTERRPIGVRDLQARLQSHA